MKKFLCGFIVMLVFFCSINPQFSKAASTPKQFATLAGDHYLIDKKGYVWDANQGINKMERVKGLSSIKMVSSISEYLYAVNKDGKVYYANKYLPDYDYKTNPTYIKRITNLPTIKQIQDIGTSSFLGLDSKGNVYHYTHDNGKVDKYKVKKATNVKKIMYKNSYYIAYLKKDHSLWVEKTTKEPFMGLKPNKPTKVLTNVKDIAGYTSIVALKHDGTVWEAGDTTYSQKKPSTNKFVKVQGLKNIKRVLTQELTNYAINTKNDTYAWGGNRTGQFGNGTFNGGWKAFDLYGLRYMYMPYPSTKPILSMKKINFIHIEGYYGTSIGLDYSGNLWSWGITKEELNDNLWDIVIPDFEYNNWKTLYKNGGYHTSLPLPDIHPSLPKKIK